MDWTPIAVVTGLVINALVVAFGYGMLIQRVKNLEDKNVTDRNDISSNRRDVEQKIEHQSHTVLPECQSTFLVLTTGIAKLEGKLDALMTMIRGTVKV